MSITRSVHFYCGKRNVPCVGLFGNKFNDYEFSNDISYTDISFSEMSLSLRTYMSSHDIKIGYCDISTDFGGGYSLNKRYKFINKCGKFITIPIKYDF